MIWNAPKVTISDDETFIFLSLSLHLLCASTTITRVQFIKQINEADECSNVSLSLFDLAIQICECSVAIGVRSTVAPSLLLFSWQSESFHLNVDFVRLFFSRHLSLMFLFWFLIDDGAFASTCDTNMIWFVLIHKLYLFPTFDRLNVSIKVNLCALKYAKWKFHMCNDDGCSEGSEILHWIYCNA